MGRGAMGRAGTGRGMTGLAVMGRVEMDRGSGRGGMGRRSTVREAVRGVARRSTVRGVARRSTVRAAVRGTARALTAPVPMVPEGSSPVPPAPAAGRNHGAGRGRAMTGAARAVPAARAGRMPGGRRVHGPSVVVRGPDRAIDSDRGRGRDHGIETRTTGATRRATNLGGRTTAGRTRVEATKIDRGRRPGIVQGTDRAGEGRPDGDRSEARPAVAARVRIDRTATARTAGVPTNGRRSSATTEVRRGRRRCHPRRRSATRRSSSPAGVRSKRRSSPGARPSVSWWSRSDAPPSRRSCFMPRTCASRSWRSKGAH